jgi:hypothetical protein
VPVALPILVPLLALLAAMTALALAQTENIWLRPLLEALSHPQGSFLKRTVFRAAGFIVTGVLYIEKHTRAALSHFAAGSLHLIVRWLNGLTHLWVGIAHEFEALAGDVADALGYLVHHRIPAMIRAAIHPVQALAHTAIHDATRAIQLARRFERDFTRGIDRLEHALKSWVLTRLHGIDRLLREGVLPRLRVAERAIAGVVTGDIPALWRRERALEREVYGDLRGRLGRIEKALGLGVFAGLVYKILARVAPWLFCRNVNTLGRAVCGLNPDTMNALLAALLGTLAVRDIRTLTEYAQAIEREVADDVRRLTSAF